MAVAVFYIYALFRPNGIICYIGKGKGYRLRAHFRRTHNPHLRSIIAQAGGDLPAIIIRGGLTESEAFELEKIFIAAIGRKANGGPLVNMSDGGIGGGARKQSAEEIAKRTAALGRPEVRAKMRASHIGQPSGRKGKKATAETREKLRISHTGKKQTPEHLENRMVKLRGRKRTAEFCAKMSALNLGKKKSDKARQNMRIAAAIRWADPAERARSSEAKKLEFADPVRRANLAEYGRRGAAARWGQ